jgi:hypothetical protein
MQEPHEPTTTEGGGGAAEKYPGSDVQTLSGRTVFNGGH